MINLSDTSKNISSLGDYLLKSFEWSETGNDLILTLLPPQKTGGSVIAKFIWAHNIDIDLCFGEYMGLGIIYSATYMKNEGRNTYDVEITFGVLPDGAISLSCSSFEILKL